MAPIIVSIEGNIGVGKTTLLERLSTDYATFPEPLSKWTLLPSYYNHPKRFGSALQFQILLSRYDQRQMFPADARLILLERSPEASRHVFVPLILDRELLGAYDRLYVNLAYKVDHFIYLDLPAERCFDRIHTRSEMDSQIGLDTLRSVQHQYTQMRSLLGGDVVDASQPEDAVEQQVRTLLTKLAPSATESA